MGTAPENEIGRETAVADFAGDLISRDFLPPFEAVSFFRIEKSTSSPSSVCSRPAAGCPLPLSSLSLSTTRRLRPSGTAATDVIPVSLSSLSSAELTGRDDTGGTTAAESAAFLGDTLTAAAAAASGGADARSGFELDASALDGAGAAMGISFFSALLYKMVKREKLMHSRISSIPLQSSH